MELSPRKVGYFVWMVTGVWGLIMGLAMIGYAVGSWGVILGIILAPITLALAPWYAVFKWGTWIPFVIIYGGAAMGAVLYAITPASSETSPPPR